MNTIRMIPNERGRKGGGGKGNCIAIHWSIGEVFFLVFRSPKNFYANQLSPLIQKPLRNAVCVCMCVGAYRFVFAYLSKRFVNRPYKCLSYKRKPLVVVCYVLKYPINLNSNGKLHK